MVKLGLRRAKTRSKQQDVQFYPAGTKLMRGASKKIYTVVNHNERGIRLVGVLRRCTDLENFEVVL